jgi:hypothetical protein
VLPDDSVDLVREPVEQYDTRPDRFRTVSMGIEPLRTQRFDHLVVHRPGALPDGCHPQNNAVSG